MLKFMLYFELFYKRINSIKPKALDKIYHIDFQYLNSKRQI